MKEIFYRMLMLLKRMLPNIKFILTGDFKQYKPVKDIYEGTYEFSGALFDLCGGNRLTLTKNRRASVDYWGKKLHQHLTNLRKGRNSFPYKEFINKHTNTKINIAFYHDTRIKVNKKYMLKFLRGRQGYKIKKRENDDHTQDVELIENMPLLCHKTSKRKYNIFNSCQYKIEGDDRKDPTI